MIAGPIIFTKSKIHESRLSVAAMTHQELVSETFLCWLIYFGRLQDVGQVSRDYLPFSVSERPAQTWLWRLESSQIRVTTSSSGI